MDKTEFEQLKKIISKACGEAQTPWEKSFTDEQQKRVETYGERVMMSKRQTDCLRKIALLPEIPEG